MSTGGDGYERQRSLSEQRHTLLSEEKETSGIVMTTVANERLTPAYLHQRDCEFFLALAGGVLLLALGLVWMLFRFGGETTTRYFAEIQYIGVAWVGAFLAFVTAYRMRRGPLQLQVRHQLTWFLVGLGMCSSGLGQAYFAYLDHLGQSLPIPSYADIGWSLYYPLVFAGLLLLPTKPNPVHIRMRLVLETFIITLCFLGINGYFVIDPAYEARKSQLSTISLLTSLSYPFWDILLIFALVLLIWQRTDRLLFPTLLLCSVGLFAFVWADTNYAYVTTVGTYSAGTYYIDAFWHLGLLSIGLSALCQYKLMAQRAYTERTTLTPGGQRSPGPPATSGEPAPRRLRAVQSTLFHLLITLLLLLTLYSIVTEDDKSSTMLAVLSVGVVLLVAVRYLLVFQEQETLSRVGKQQRADAHRLRVLTGQLANVFEPDLLLQRTVALATAGLGFDGAVLLLFDVAEHPSDTARGVPVYTATHISQEPIMWRLQVAGIEQWSSLFEEGEVLWPQRTTTLPVEVRTWLHEQNLLLTLFLPLTSQGKILGCLGVCSRSTRHFSPAEYYLAKAYAEHTATAIKQAQLYQQLQMAHQRLQELDKLKDQFLITASHELRTPLTAVQGYLELLVQWEDVLPDEQRKEFLTKAQRACEELMLLLNNVTDASRLEMAEGIRSDTVERVSVQDMIHSILDLLEPTLLQERRTVRVDIPADLTVLADPTRLSQVLRNLSVNALKYSPAGTPITFSAHAGTAAGPCVVMSVIDQGKGIAPHEQARLFQRFVRLERDLNSPVRGTGLGLYLSRRLIEAMGGTIWVESSGVAGQGAAFHIQLPTAEDGRW